MVICCRSKPIPYGFAAEMRPPMRPKYSTSIILRGTTPTIWRNAIQVNPYIQPISIYEVHLGSWQRDENGLFLSYDELANA